MKRTLLLLVALVAGCTRANASEPAVVVPAPQRELALDLGPRRLPYATLDAEVLRALETWTNVGQATVVPEATLAPWAGAIAGVARSREEAITLASIAAIESRFLPWVLDGSCNDAAWRATRRGWERTACDNGWAVGPWQRHSKRLLGKEPAEVAEDAVRWLRAMPKAWTTWRAARAQADAWLAAR